ncbi:MAG: cytochrome P450, partial [Acidimicrobiales bacterium]
DWYIVSTYDEIVALLHDPRISSHSRPQSVGGQEGRVFIGLDPPDHDKLRRMAMATFGPPHQPGRVDGLREHMTDMVDELIDAMRGKGRVDIVDDFAYPFPVSVICAVLGVPREDEPQFHGWSQRIIALADLDPSMTAEARAARQADIDQARLEMGLYFYELAEKRKAAPGDDILSRLATAHGPDGQMDPVELVSTAILLLIAGHETTVNLTTNGMLMLLRHPDLLERVRNERELVVGLVEELLRFEPPIQALPNRIAAEDVTIAGTTIPKGAHITLLLAAGSRDPKRFPDPERFDPDRADNQHLGFGSGIHYCFGAPMARLEVQIALSALVRRLVNPRLVEDPPPYRHNTTLRGPRHLLVDIDGIVD